MRKIVDSDGVEVTAECAINFAYGIPPVPVIAQVVERDGVLIALTPGHNPSEARVSTLRKHVGDFWVMGTADVHR
jgi:hypothetical protein